MSKASRTPSPTLLGTTFAARELQLGENTLRRLADSGQIPCVRDASNKRLFEQSALATFKRQRQS